MTYFALLAKLTPRDYLGWGVVCAGALLLGTRLSTHKEKATS